MKVGIEVITVLQYAMVPRIKSCGETGTRSGADRIANTCKMERYSAGAQTIKMRSMDRLGRRSPEPFGRKLIYHKENNIGLLTLPKCREWHCGTSL